MTQAPVYDDRELDRTPPQDLRYRLNLIKCNTRIFCQVRTTNNFRRRLFH